MRRQAGWAKTFGLPLELISADEAQRLFPPMSTEGVLGAAYLPTDGFIDPAQLTAALIESARRGGAEVHTNTRVVGIDVERGRVVARAHRPRRRRDRGRGRCRRDLRARDRRDGRRATCPIVPMAHEYLITKPMGLPLDLPTMRDPSLLVYFRGEVGGLVAGGYERNPAPWGLDGIPGDFNGKLLPGGLGAVRAADGERRRPRSGAGERGGRQARQRPGGVHARRRVHPGADGRRRVLGRGRVLRARPGGLGRHGPPGRRVDRGGAAGVRRLAHGLAAVRPPLRDARRTRSRARPRCTRPTTT